MKIGIVGSGLVGSTAAYALIMKGVGREIVLVDKDEARARAEANDNRHAVPFAHPLEVRSGPYRDLKGCRVVIVAAGVSQRPGESRLDLLKRNAAVFQEVVPSILEHAKDPILVIATNPVDIMTHLAARYAAEEGLGPERVIGSGTTLDTARFRTLLSTHVGVDPHHVHAYVIGEHGDSEVLTWSLVRIGAMELENFCQRQGVHLNRGIRDAIDNDVRNAAYTIIEGKGATYYGIGSALAKIVDVLIHDQRSILTVTTPTEEVVGVKDVSVSLPRVVGGRGVMGTFPLPLSEDESAALQRSAQLLRDAINELDRSG